MILYTLWTAKYHADVIIPSKLWCFIVASLVPKHFLILCCCHSYGDWDFYFRKQYFIFRSTVICFVIKEIKKPLFACYSCRFFTFSISLRWYCFTCIHFRACFVIEDVRTERDSIPHIFLFRNFVPIRSMFSKLWAFSVIQREWRKLTPLTYSEYPLFRSSRLVQS